MDAPQIGVLGHCFSYVQAGELGNKTLVCLKDSGIVPHAVPVEKQETNYVMVTSR